jgi:hypothetical protein
MSDIERDLGRLEAKVDLLIASLPQQNDRITALENWRSYVNGGFAALTSAVAVIGWILSNLKA